MTFLRYIIFALFFCYFSFASAQKGLDAPMTKAVMNVYKQLLADDPSDYETYEEYFTAQQKLGFEYEITIYRDYPDLEILNDPDFESVFELFRAHTTR